MQKTLHLALIQSFQSHRQKSREAFQKLNLTEGQPKILMHLLRKDGSLQKDLSEACGVRPATMTSLLKKMQEQNLIVKKETHISGGKRGYLIFLTDHGRNLACEVAQILDSVEQLSFQGFSEKEKEQLFCLLERVTANLSD